MSKVSLTETEEDDDGLLEDHQERAYKSNLERLLQRDLLELLERPVAVVARRLAQLLGFAPEKHGGEGLGDEECKGEGNAEENE